MEEISLVTKIIVLAMCAAMVVLLAGHEKIFGKLRRSPKASKPK